MAAENYYEVLGLRRGVSDEDVKQAFRELAKTLHPDRNPDDPEAERRFKLVTTAYEALKDQSRRKAYDEWLVFAQKNDRSRLEQWGRLAAMLLLLLIGPSIALYWAFLALQGWDAPSEKRLPTVAMTRQQGTTGSSKIDARIPPEPTTPRPVPPSVTARQSPGQNEPAEIAAATPDEAGTSRDSASGAPPSPAPSEPPSRAPLDNTGALPRDIASAEPAPASPRQSLPPRSPIPATAPAESTAPAEPAQTRPRQSLRELAGLDDATQSPPVSPAVSTEPRVSTPPSSAGNDSEGSARSMARLMAEVKEAAGMSQSGSAAREPRLTAIEPELPRRSRIGDGDEFTDCDGCPVMSVVAVTDFTSVAREGARGRSPRSLAISKAEVSIAEWNACVRDGFCTGYRNDGAGNGGRPVSDVTRAEARQYAEWLSRKTGRPYRLMKVGGWERTAGTYDSRTDDSSSQGRRGVDCSAPEWEWIEEAECASRTGERSRRGDSPERPRALSETGSGFRVTRSLGPDG